MKNASFSIFRILLLVLLLNVADSEAQTAGSLDTTFGSGGTLAEPLRVTASLNDLAIQPDGKIIAAGMTLDPSGVVGVPVVARFNANGTRDTTFDDDGYNNTFGISEISSVKLQPDGKILIGGGRRDSFGFRSFAVVRLNANGSPDTNFNGTGVAAVQIGGGGTVTSIVLQADGKIVASGPITLNGSSGPKDFGLVRYNANGSLDGSFGTGGRVATDFNNNSNDVPNDSALQTDGKIVIVGSTSDVLSNSELAAIVRYNSDGTIDSTFATGGKLVRPGASTPFAEVELQADGKIIVVGANPAPIRYNPNGTLDITFQPPQTSDYIFLQSVIIQADGKVIAGGGKRNAGNMGNSIFALVRYNGDGTLDTTFGTNGLTLTGFTQNNVDVFVGAIAIQSDGKIVAGSEFSSFIFLARYRSSAAYRAGFPDFNGDGKDEISVFRPSTGEWYMSFDLAGGYSVSRFGNSTDRIVPADYDGDGKTDLAVYRSGVWYVQRSQMGFTGIQFGTISDIPVPADYDGDGKADFAVFRPSNGTWYLQTSSAGFLGVQFGVNGDAPATGDYDGDGKADLAVFRTGTWYLQRSTAGFTGIRFGIGGDKIVPADYDGDGKNDLAVFRPSDGTWYLQRSTAGFAGIRFGEATDLPTPADYDGDGRADVAVYRNGVWYLNRSTQGFLGISFGTAADNPIQNAFVH